MTLDATTEREPNGRRRRSDTRQDVDSELAALTTCARALSGLSDDARSRVLLYLARRYGHDVLPDPGDPQQMSFGDGDIEGTE